MLREKIRMKKGKEEERIKEESRNEEGFRRMMQRRGFEEKYRREKGQGEIKRV